MIDLLIVVAAIVSVVIFMWVTLRFFSWLAHRERKSAGHRYKNRGPGNIGVGGYIAGGYGDSGVGDGGGGD